MALILLWGEAAAAPACHCFTDRIFDPAQPAKADPYILATTQNSFFAAAFGIPKETVVRAKMGGAASEDLWIAYFAAARLGLRPGDLMASRSGGRTWRTALEDRRVSLSLLGERFADAVLTDRPPREMAALAAGEMLASLVGTGRADLDAAVAAGASVPELVAAALIARWSGRTALSVFQGAAAGKASWGAELQRLGISPEGLAEKIAFTLR